MIKHPTIRRISNRRWLSNSVITTSHKGVRIQLGPSIAENPSRPFVVRQPIEAPRKFAGQRVEHGEHRAHAGSSLREPIAAEPSTVAAQLQKNNIRLPNSSWVHISGIPPLSTMDEMLETVNGILEGAQNSTGILDLDSPYVYGEEEAPTLPKNDSCDWVGEAKLILSPFGRPFGWYMDLGNRSVAYTLLQHCRSSHLRCLWKQVIIQSTSCEQVQELEQPFFSDATIRVENCQKDVNDFLIMNLFARYELSQEREAIVEWKGITNDGRIPPKTFLVHFDSPSWARAALREKQGVPVSGFPVWLAPYPRQRLRESP